MALKGPQLGFGRIRGREGVRGFSLQSWGQLEEVTLESRPPWSPPAGGQTLVAWTDGYPWARIREEGRAQGTLHPVPGTSKPNPKSSHTHPSWLRSGLVAMVAKCSPYTSGAPGQDRTSGPMPGSWSVSVEGRKELDSQAAEEGKDCGMPGMEWEEAAVPPAFCTGTNGEPKDGGHAGPNTEKKAAVWPTLGILG